MTQVEIAPLLGVTENWVSQLERGKRKPSRSVDALLVSLESDPLYLEAVEIANANPVRRAREAAGLTIKELAKRMVPYPIGVLQAVEEGRAQISDGMASAYKRAIPELDVEALRRNDENALIVGVTRATVGTKPDIRLPPGMTARYVPLLSWAQMGELTGYEDQYEFEGQLVFDAKDPKAFAVALRGDSMEPKFSSGDVAIVYPSREPHNGNLVIGKTVGGEVFFKLLTILGSEEYQFSSYNNPPHGPFTRRRAELAWLYPVASVSKSTL